MFIFIPTLCLPLPNWEGGRPTCGSQKQGLQAPILHRTHHENINRLKIVDHLRGLDGPNSK